MSEWIAAAEVGDLNALRTLLEHGQAVEEEDENGCTAFQLAAGGGHVEAARLLMEHGARIQDGANFMSNGRDSAAMARLFLEAGVTRDALLDVAAQFCSAATVGALLDAGADPNRKDETGEVPLYRAIQNKSTAVLQLLLERGADLTLLNEDGTHSLHFCAPSRSSAVSGSSGGSWTAEAGLLNLVTVSVFIACSLWLLIGLNTSRARYLFFPAIHQIRA